MILDCFVLDMPDSEFPGRLAKALRAQGHQVAVGPTPRRSRVLVCVGAPRAEILADCVRQGTAVLPVRAEPGGWLGVETDLEALADRVVSGVEALLAAGVPERLRDAEVTERAIADVDAMLAARERSDDRLEVVCDAVSLAITRGAPIYNAGSPEGCATLYRHTARRLGALLEQDRSGLLDAVRLELMGALATVEEDVEDADEVAWTLRHAFDRILIARHTADALQVLDRLFDGLRTAGRVLNASLVYDVISLAISHGAPIYNAGSHLGCAQIYARTARGLLDCLGPERSGESRTEALARSSLPSLLEGLDDRLLEDSAAVSWDLRHAFDALVDLAAEERAWEHDC